MLPGRRTDNGSIFVIQGTPPAGTPLVGGIAVSPLGAIYINGGAGFSPLDLFAQNEQGAWYDPSDLSTMFQDSAGITPVTAAGQPVGKILDKSGNNNHASQATAAKRPLLQNDGVNNYLAFDGVDDALATAAIDFTSTAQMSVFHGELFTTATSMVYELSSDFNSNNAFSSYRQGFVQFATQNSGQYSSIQFTPAVSTKLVISAFSDRSLITDEVSIRRNGVVPTVTRPNNQNLVGNFGNYPLYIGARNQASLYYNGRIYSLIVLGRTATPQEITDTETWVNGKTGAY